MNRGHGPPEAGGVGSHCPPKPLQHRAGADQQPPEVLPEAAIPYHGWEKLLGSTEEGKGPIKEKREREVMGRGTGAQTGCCCISAAVPTALWLQQHQVLASAALNFGYPAKKTRPSLEENTS